MRLALIQRALAALASVAALSLGAGTASASTVQVTIDFDGARGVVPSPYVEDGFELAGNALGIIDVQGQGNPIPSIILDSATPTLTLTRTGGGAFSLLSFDYSCGPGVCDFTVGDTLFDRRSSNIRQFVTAPLSGFDDVTSVLFAQNSTQDANFHRIDNIVLSYDDMAVIPLPAALPLLLAGLGGLGLVARRKRTSV